MAKALQEFDKRAKSVMHKHRQLAGGYVTKVDRDGVIVHKPMRRFRLLRPRSIVYTLAGVTLFKALLLTQLGDANYGDRLSRLASGSAVERAGAFVMADDPATRWVATNLARVLPGVDLVAATQPPTQVTSTDLSSD